MNVNIIRNTFQSIVAQRRVIQMPKSLRNKIKHLAYKGELNERERDRILNALDNEQKQGEWIASTEYGSILHKCSKCHKYNDWESDFCPNCGADMRGD
jgi:Leu/Phe-tRNA-protein transferase